MKNIATTIQEIKKMKSENMQNIDYSQFRTHSLVFIYHYSYLKSKSEDIAGDTYLYAESCIDKLIHRFTEGDAIRYLGYLKKITSLLLMDLYKLQKRREVAEERAVQYLQWERKIPLFSSHKEDRIEAEEDFKENLRNKLSSLSEVDQYIFFLKYDLEMDEVFLWRFKKFLESRGMRLGDWERMHLQKREIFLRKKEKMLKTMQSYTRRIWEDAENFQVSEWRKKKRLKASRLKAFINQGLYKSQELSEILGLSRGSILKKITKWKTLPGFLSSGSPQDLSFHKEAA